jgi:hypothetical protein
VADSGQIDPGDPCGKAREPVSNGLPIAAVRNEPDRQRMGSCHGALPQAQRKTVAPAESAPASAPAVAVASTFYGLVTGGIDCFITACVTVATFARRLYLFLILL